MDDLIVAAIRRRLKTKATDLGGSLYPSLKPCDPVDVAHDERRLGFTLRPLLIASSKVQRHSNYQGPVSRCHPVAF